MSEMSRLYATNETFREVANLLFGGGADELVAKFSGTPAEQERKKRASVAALSGVGATAGAAGLGLAAHELRHEYKRQAPKFKPARSIHAVAEGEKAVHRAQWGSKGRQVGRTLKATVRNKKLATTLLPLEVAGLGGELMATKILHGDAKKKTVSKSEPGSSDVHIPNAGQLKRVAGRKAVNTAVANAPRVKKGALKLVQAQEAVVTKSVTWEGEISKVDTDKRQVFGWASIVEINGEPVVDLQGDYIDIDEIEKSAYDYVIKSRKGGEMHRRDGEAPVHVSDMIESFLVTPEKKEKLGLPDSVPTGWWVGYQINDDDAWNLVKSGKRTGFSIHGRGQRTPSEI